MPIKTLMRHLRSRIDLLSSLWLLCYFNGFRLVDPSKKSYILFSFKSRCRFVAKDIRDEGMKWRLGMAGVMWNRQRQGFETQDTTSAKSKFLSLGRIFLAWIVGIGAAIGIAALIPVLLGAAFLGLLYYILMMFIWWKNF